MPKVGDTVTLDFWHNGEMRAIPATVTGVGEGDLLDLEMHWPEDITNMAVPQSAMPKQDLSLKPEDKTVHHSGFWRD